ncbi:MAG: protoporphyrinogen oxidase [Thermodesulfovibrionales bacterium]
MARLAIIGGGISGLSLAFCLLKKHTGYEITVFESEKIPGGKIKTERTEGFLCEWGVNGFLDNRPKTLELCRRLSIEPLRSNDASRKRFIFSGGRLHRLPESPPAFLKSDLLTLTGRMRVMMEPLLPGNPRDEETLAGFARRRLGREALDKLIDPMASGIYAGNPETLSLRACFPKVYDLEKNYGGLVRGMIGLQRARKKQGSAEKVGAGPGGVLTSFSEGMGVMVKSLELLIGTRLRTGYRAVSIERTGGGYSIGFADGSSFEAECVVIASPAYAAAEMLKPLDRRLSNLVAEIPYPSLSVACFGYRKEKMPRELDAFGYLIPSGEKRKILGTLYDSCIFPNRAPEGYVLLRSMVGGARASELALESDKRITDMVIRELSDIIGISAHPDFVRIFRHEFAIPQYTVGHLERLRTLELLREKHPGLYLTGNPYRGIGVNDCIEQASLLSQKIIEDSF